MKKSLPLVLILTVITSLCAWSQGRIITIDTPKMTVYLPANQDPSGRSIVVCPGGGYSHLATNHEGHAWAAFYNNLGIACAVLEYQMPETQRQRLLDEVESAFKIMADSAAVWKIAADQIGIQGSSAGGHLASTVATHPHGPMKPAYQVLFYPVISLDPAITHKGTRDRFVGPDADKALTDQWSNHLNVTPQTPTAFITLSADDRAVPPVNSINYFEALLRNGVPAAMFCYPTGGHGWGYKTSFKYHHQMLAELTAWLQNLPKTETK